MAFLLSPGVSLSFSTSSEVLNLTLSLCYRHDPLAYALLALLKRTLNFSSLSYSSSHIFSFFFSWEVERRRRNFVFKTMHCYLSLFSMLQTILPIDGKEKIASCRMLLSW